MAKIRTSRSAFLGRSAARPSGLRLAQFDPIDPMDEVAALMDQAVGDLSALSSDELGNLRSALHTAYTEIRPSVESDDQVEALRSMVEAVTRIDGEIETRAQAAAEREAALSALDEQVAPPAAAAGDGEGGEGDGAGGEGAGDGETGGDAGTETGDAGEAGAGEGSEGAATGGEAAAGEQAPAEPAVQAASAAPRRPSLSSLRRAPRRTTEPGEAAVEPADASTSMRLAGRIVASSAMADIGRAEAFRDVDHLGQAIATMATDLKVPDQGVTDRKHYLGRRPLVDRAHVVLASEFRGEENDMVDEAIRRNRERLNDDARIVASGGTCAPPMPDYTITTVGDRGATWSDALPTVQGNRPISFFQNINMSLRANAGSRVGARPNGGIGVVTEAQDAAGYGGGGGQHQPKDCVKIDCPTPVTSQPEAMFQCTTIGNFVAITFPEYVRAFDDIIGFYFDVERDEKNLAKFVAAAKKLSTTGPTFGAARDLLDIMRRYAAHLRSVRKAPNLPIHFDFPAFARYMIAQDIASSWSDGTTNMRITAQQALGLLAVDEGIFVGEYDVSIGATANGSHTVLPELVDGHILPTFPSQIRILAYPDGAMWRQDYGELAFGLRETGMSTNDFSAFMEIFEQVNFRTTDLAVIDAELCINGAFGAAVAKSCDDTAPVSE